MSRHEERKDWEIKHRVDQLEWDLDKADKEEADYRKRREAEELAYRREREAEAKEQRRQTAKVFGTLLAMLVAIIAATVGVALQLGLHP